MGMAPVVKKREILWKMIIKNQQHRNKVNKFMSQVADRLGINNKQANSTFKRLLKSR